MLYVDGLLLTHELPANNGRVSTKCPTPAKWSLIYDLAQAGEVSDIDELTVVDKQRCWHQACRE